MILVHSGRDFKCLIIVNFSLANRAERDALTIFYHISSGIQQLYGVVQSGLRENFVNVFFFGEWDIYFFLSVKKDFRFDSSFCDEAGNVIDRLSPLAALWHCAFRAPTHWFISASSCACRRNSAPVESLEADGMVSKKMYLDRQ